MFHYKVIRLSPKDVPLISALREPKRLSNKNVIIIVWCPALNANDMNCGGGGGRVVEALCKQTEGSEMKAESLFGSFVWEMRAADFSMCAAGSCGSLVPEVDPTTGEMHSPAISTSTVDRVTRRWRECCVFRDAIMQALIIINGYVVHVLQPVCPF